MDLTNIVKFQLHGGRGQKVFVVCAKESLIYKDTFLKKMRSQHDENNIGENSTDSKNNTFLGF